MAVLHPRVCGHCQAPLPSGRGDVVCVYCNTSLAAAQPSATASPLAAPEQVVRQTAHPATVRQLRWGVFAGVVMMGLGAGTVAWLVTRQAPQGSRRTPPASRASLAEAAPPLDAAHVVPLIQRLHALYAGPGAVYAQYDQRLAKLDDVTLVPQWVVELPNHWRSETKLITVGSRVVLADETGFTFYDDAVGTRLGQFVIKHSFTWHLCTDGDALLVNTSFLAPFRIDGPTMKKVPGRTKCPETGYCETGAHETCVRKPQRFGDERCDVTLVSGGVEFTPCRVDDGSGTYTLMASRKHKRWWWTAIPHEGRPELMTVVGATLLVRWAKVAAAYSATDGQPLWQQPVAWGPAVVTADRARLVVAQDGRLVAIEVTNGRVAATFPQMAAPVPP